MKNIIKQLVSLDVLFVIEKWSLVESIENLEVYAMDNAKEAIILGSRKEEKINWIVGDLANISIKEESMDLLINKEYSNKTVIDYFVKHMECKEVLNLSYKMPVTRNHIDNFLKMTPMMFNVDKEKLLIENITHITFHFTVIVGNKQKDKMNFNY